MEFLTLAILILLSAFFSGAETAITAIPRFKLKRLVDQKIRGAKALSALRENPSRIFSTILVGNNLVNIGASILGATVITNFLSKMGWGGAGLAIGVSTGVMTFILLVFGEISPKTIAIHKPERMALWVAPIVLVFEIIFKPIIIIVTFFSYPLTYLFGAGKPIKSPVLTEEEIKAIISTGESEGVIEKGEKKMITSIFEIGDIPISEVMKPRMQMLCIDINTLLEEAIKTIIDTGYSRFPVYEENLDKIVGVVFAKEVLARKKGEILRDYLHEAIYISPTEKVNNLLSKMQATNTHLAIVANEQKETLGLVALEDLIEEIVGEIYDEFEKGRKK